MKIKFFKNVEEAKLPEFSIGNVGLDFFTIETELLNPGERYLFDTGLRIKIEEGYALILKDRSGNAAKRGLHVLAGVIDSSYTGTLKVVLLNTDITPRRVNAGDKICQGVIIKDYVPELEVIEVFSEEELGFTFRNEKGFGSSGL